jgi:hypothetical protein
MTFEEILDQAIAMLQRRGRLTYGTLKRQFQLDDAALDDLKDELIYGQRVAADEDGRVLVWTGDTAACPLTDQLGQRRIGRCDIGAIRFLDGIDRQPDDDPAGVAQAAP